MFKQKILILGDGLTAKLTASLLSKLDLEIEAKTHIEQLQIYESLFDDDHPVQKAIYFVAQGKLVLI